MSLAKLKDPHFPFLRLDVQTSHDQISDFLDGEGSVVIDADSVSIVWEDDTAPWPLYRHDVLVRIVDTIHVFEAAEFAAYFDAPNDLS
jgi:hypothetical protein